jgi:hypothetical protein
MLEAFLFSELLSLPDSLKFEYQNALPIEQSLWGSVLYCFLDEWYEGVRCQSLELFSQSIMVIMKG